MPRSVKLVPFLVLVSALCAAMPAAADTIYKWVDEKGVTQFTQTPPPAGTKVDKVDVRVPAARAEATPPAVAPEAPKMAEGKRKQREERCRQARLALEKLNSAEPVMTIDEKGEKVPVADAERPKHIVQVRKVIAQQCDEPARDATPR
jgi:hypothetical protein